jgi:peptidoglycan hydrolase-like protein with peptidoglycan-binding domain
MEENIMNVTNEKKLISVYNISDENSAIINKVETENKSVMDDTAVILNLSDDAISDGIVMVKNTASTFALTSSQINSAQTNLRRLGFYNGSNTGVVSTEMQESIRNFQKVYGMEETGLLTQNVYDKIREVNIKFTNIYNSNTLNTLALNSEFNLDATQKKNFALIWTFLDKSMGISGEQIVGVMANIRAESGFSSDNLQDPSNGPYTIHDPNYVYNEYDEIGYGILQWTFRTRKEGLLEMSNTMNRDVSDINVQLAYFRKEMTMNFNDLYYVEHWENLKETNNYLDACDVFLEEIESPETLNYEERRNYANIIFNIMNSGGFV